LSPGGNSFLFGCDFTVCRPTKECPPMAKSKFFRIAVEGATVDGREISRQWLEEMAASYDPATYTARINCEHIAGYSPDRPFNAYGSVLSLKTEEVSLNINGKPGKRLALFAEIDANDQLVEINKAGQKLFTSCEIHPNFAGEGKAYLVGLAVTDSPASLGTEALKFATLSRPNIFTEASEIAAIELLAEDDGNSDAVNGAFASMKAFFDRFSAPQPPAQQEPAKPANDNADFSKLNEGLGLMAKSITALSEKMEADTGALRTDLTELKTKLASTEAPGFNRKPATGGGAQIVTDC
jgi:hypothetical protein